MNFNENEKLNVKVITQDDLKDQILDQIEQQKLKKTKQLRNTIRKLSKHKRVKHHRELQTGVRHRMGRNEKCPCKSGKKFKRCCINKVRVA